MLGEESAEEDDNKLSPSPSKSHNGGGGGAAMDQTPLRNVYDSFNVLMKEIGPDAADDGLSTAFL